MQTACGSLRQTAIAAGPTSATGVSSEIAEGQVGPWVVEREELVLAGPAVGGPGPAGVQVDAQRPAVGPRRGRRLPRPVHPAHDGLLVPGCRISRWQRYAGSGSGSYSRRSRCLLAVRLAVDDQEFLGLLHDMEKVHEQDAQGEGDERAVEGDPELVGHLLDEVRVLLVAGLAHAAGQPADGAEEPDRRDRPGQVRDRAHAGDEPVLLDSAWLRTTSPTSTALRLTANLVEGHLDHLGQDVRPLAGASPRSCGRAGGRPRAGCGPLRRSAAGRGGRPPAGA